MDLYRYSAPGVHSVATGGSGSTAYFSIDNGTTNLATWNNNPSNGDLGDWYPSGPAPGGKDMANDYATSGVINTFSATDILNMQALGWTVAGPAAPTISFTPDTGVPSDGITNATILILAGTATAGDTVNVFDGTTLLGTVTADGTGHWTYTTATLANGGHSFKATDTVSGLTSAVLPVTVDTTIPTGGTPDLVAASDSGSSNTDNVTNVTNPTFAVALNSSVAAGDTVELLLGGASLAHAVTHTVTSADITAGSVSLTVTAGDLGASGSKSISAKFSDAAGNTSTTSALAITLDTTTPSETISSTIGTDTGSTTTISSGGLTKDNTLALSGTVSDANGVSSVQVYDGINLLGAATVTAGTWNFTTAALANGSHSFTAIATDNAGNTTTTAAVTATVDTTAPTGGTPDLVAASDSGSSTTDNVTNITSPTFTVALNPTVAAGDIVELLLGGASLAHAVTHTITAADITAGSVSLTVTAGDLGTSGSKSISAKFSDAAGNTSTTSALAVTLDTTTPTGGTPDLIAASDSGSSATDNVTKNITPTFTVALNPTVAAGDIVELLLGGASLAHAVTHTITSADITAGSVSLTVTAGDLGTDGSKSIAAKFTDAAGNTSTTSALAITLDTTAPSETISSTIGTDTGLTTTISSGDLTKDNTLALSGTVSDANGVSSVKVYDGANLLGTATVNCRHLELHHLGSDGRRSQLHRGCHRQCRQHDYYRGGDSNRRHHRSDRRHAGLGCGVGLRQFEYRQHHQHHQPDLYGRAQSDGRGRRHRRAVCWAARHWPMR